MEDGEIMDLELSKSRLLELALELAGSNQTHDILGRAVKVLESVYPGTHWAILDQVTSGRYRATSTVIGVESLGGLLREVGGAEKSLVIHEMNSSCQNDLVLQGDATHFIEREGEHPDVILGAWGKDGPEHRLSCLPINEACSLIGGAVEAAREVEWLRNQSKVDELTGIANRRGILDALLREELRIKRYGGSLSILFVDLNRFKEINDLYGHKCGDRVLTFVAATLQNVLRGSDAIGRLGGDEFLAVLPGVELSEAKFVATRMREALRLKALPLAGVNVPVSASIGAASVNEGLMGMELIERADERMYYSKRRAGSLDSLTPPVKERELSEQLA